jgi:putative ABC transport system ATP-binding protein
VTLTDVRLTGRNDQTTSATGISLLVLPGQSVALYAPADATAVELLDAVAGRRRVRNGRITVHGTTHRLGVPACDRYPGDRWLQSGRFPLLPSRSVTSNMVTALRARRPDAAARARIAELLVITGAANLAARRVDTLSAEQQWRILIARAMLNEPQLVAAEDPSPGLDSRTAAHVLDMLMDAQARFAFTLLLATRRLATAARCDRVVGLVDGQVTMDDLIGEDAWTRGRVDRIG